MKRWSEKFEALPDTRIKVINEKGYYTVKFDFLKFGKRFFRKVEESVIEKLYKIEHDRNCYRRNLIFSCKIFPEYVDELRDTFIKAYGQYLSDGPYGYHYEEKYWDMFHCKELERAKHWDGYTEEDVGRLMSIPDTVTSV